MKAGKKNTALEGIKKVQLKRATFTLEFKAEVVQREKAENLSLAEFGRKFEVLRKLVKQWEKQNEAGQLTQAAGRRAVSPEQAEITRLRADLSRARMEVSILKKRRYTLRERVSEVHLYPRRAVDVPAVGRLLGAWRHPVGLSRVVSPGAIDARAGARSPECGDPQGV